jgi:hypothetical protein
VNVFISRIIRASKLDANLYEEVEADTTALGQAMAVVVLSSIAAGSAYIGRIGMSGVFIGMIITLFGWLVWACITYFIGTKLLPEPQTRSNPGELLRTIGFSSSPGLIRILGIVPGLAGLINIVASVWMLVAMVIAVRQALDYSSTGRAVIVCIAGWLVQGIIMVLMLLVLVDTAAQPLTP